MIILMSVSALQIPAPFRAVNLCVCMKTCPMVQPHRLRIGLLYCLLIVIIFRTCVPVNAFIERMFYFYHIIKATSVRRIHFDSLYFGNIQLCNDGNEIEILFIAKSTILSIIKIIDRLKNNCREAHRENRTLIIFITNNN